MLNFLCFFVLFNAVKADSKLTLHMGKSFYYSTYRDEIKHLEDYILKKFFFCHVEIVGWTFGFPEITAISSAH